MSLSQIEDAKHLRTYCERLGRVGMVEEIVRIARLIVENPEHGQAVMRNAGKIRAICMGAKCDGYWDEKQSQGFFDAVAHARHDNRQACSHEYGKKRDVHDGRTIQDCTRKCGASLITEADGRTWIGA